ncbi:hypothetical protein Tco_0646346 [Tanacetum coccineum]
MVKTQAYETFQFKEKNVALINQGSLENIRCDLLQKEKAQLQKDFKISQDKDIDKSIALENQVKFLNDIIYKTNQSVQTIHMLAPNPISYYNGRASFVNPMYLKKAQSEKPCFYKVPYDKDDLANIFAPNCEEILILEEEKLDELQSNKTEFSNEYDLLLQECLSKDSLCVALCSMTDIDEYSKMACKYPEKVKECECLEIELSKQKDSVSKEDYHKLVKSFCTLEQHLISLKLSLQQCKEQLQNDKVWKQQESTSFREFNQKYYEIQDLKAQLQDRNIAIINKTDVHKGLSKPVTPQNLPQTQIGKQAEINKNVIKPRMYRIDARTAQTRTTQLPQTFRNSNNQVFTSIGVIHNTSVSKPQPRSNKVKDKVVQNNSQAKIKQKEVEDHHRISSFFNKTKSVSACNDSLMSRTSNFKAVYATCGKCVSNSNHDACVFKFLNDVNARSKKP